MARFPSKEAEVFALAQEMMTGLAATVYPSPPVTGCYCSVSRVFGRCVIRPLGTATTAVAAGTMWRSADASRRHS